MIYLDEFLQQISTSRTDEDVLGRLSRWQFERRGDQVNAIDTLNAQLGYGQTDDRRLQPSHLPTTAIGRLDGLVVVSANPGYNADRNGLENALRSTSADGNEAFCKDFFSRYPEVVNSTSKYWTWVLGLWKEAFLEPDDPRHAVRGRALWALAHREQWPVGGIDLIPFNSSKDGITARLHELQDGRWLQLAKATLLMACRIRSGAAPGHPSKRRIVLVASSRGDAMVREVASEGGLQPVEMPPDWHAALRMSVWRALPSVESPDTLVLSLPFQYITRMPKGFRREHLASALRDLAAR